MCKLVDDRWTKAYTGQFIGPDAVGILPIVVGIMSNQLVMLGIQLSRPQTLSRTHSLCVSLTSVYKSGEMTEHQVNPYLHAPICCI